MEIVNVFLDKTKYFIANPVATGKYYINPIKHAMLHCCETQLEGEKFRQQVTDNLPVEFLVQFNF